MVESTGQMLSSDSCSLFLGNMKNVTISVMKIIVLDARFDRS
jgi:hypothetical protein